MYAWQQSNLGTVEEPRIASKEKPELVAAVSTSAAQSAAILGLAVATHSGGYYDPACVAQVDFAYNQAYAQYLADHDNWQNVLIPAWQAALQHYYNVYLPAYLADAAAKGAEPYNRGQIPTEQPLNEYDKVDRIADVQMNSYPCYNPNPDLTSVSSSVPQQLMNKFDYRSYTQFQIDFGRNLVPGVVDGLTEKVPLSLQSPYCPTHSEAVSDPEAGSITLSFPPREQPVHAARRSLIRVIKVLQLRNQGVPGEVKDKVAIIGFDGFYPSLNMQPIVVQSLTGDYDAAMQACTTLQPTGDKLATTAMESGMIKAKQQLDVLGRSFTDKVVIVLSDGVPNISQSGNGTIDSYVSGVSGPDAGQFYTSDPLTWPGSKYWFNGPLMQAREMRLDNWDVFAVGLGFGADADFLNRMAVLGGTSGIGQGLQAGGDPSQYEEQLTTIFKQIIFTPTVRLVD